MERQHIRNRFLSWIAGAHVHDLYEWFRTKRAISRNAYGVGKMEDLPFPGNVVNSGNKNSGWLKGALLAAMLLVGGGGATLLALRPGVPAPAPPAATAPAAPPAAVAPAPSAPTVPAPAPVQRWDQITERQNPDGSWSEIKREHLPPSK